MVAHRSAPKPPIAPPKAAQPSAGPAWSGLLWLDGATFGEAKTLIQPTPPGPARQRGAPRSLSAQAASPLLQLLVGAGAFLGHDRRGFRHPRGELDPQPVGVVDVERFAVAVMDHPGF